MARQLVAAAAVAVAAATSPMDNGRAVKPPMGWRWVASGLTYQVASTRRTGLRQRVAPRRSWNQLGASTTQTDMIVQMVGHRWCPGCSFACRRPFPPPQGGIASRSRNVNGVPTSLKDLGYTDVGLDDFWQECGSYGPNK